MHPPMALNDHGEGVFVTFSGSDRYIRVEDYDDFFRNNRERLFAYLLRFTGDYHLASDLMQEAFTRYLDRYGCSGGKPALLFTIARNAALDAIRKRREDRPDSESDTSPIEDPERQVILKQAVDRILAAIGQLGSDDRELIALLAAETFSYREIADLLGISEGNVKVRVHRARIRLKAILAQGDS